jgi:hypothetical protein
LISGEGKVIVSGNLELSTPNITKHISATAHWEKVMNRGVPNWIKYKTRYCRFSNRKK